MNFPSKTEFTEKLLTKEMSGELGQYRAPGTRNFMQVSNDYQAIQAWLTNKFKQKTNTLRTYQAQVERLLLWSVLVKEKPISSLNQHDYEDYISFLKDPTPNDYWIMSKGSKAKRWEDDWKPFTGPLSASSIATALNAINTMLNYWREFGYIECNMLKMIDLTVHKKPRLTQQLTVVERALTKQEWHAMLKVVENMPESTLRQTREKIRLKFLLITMLVTAMRRDEVANLKWSHFGKQRDVWRLQVTGKGQKPALLVLPDSYIELANIYRKQFNYESLRSNCIDNEDEHVFVQLVKFKPISAGYINELIKKTAIKASDYINDEESKQRLKQVSAHWIRHTAATVLDDAGVDKSIIKFHLRHESDSTTEIYIHKSVEVIKESLEKIF